MAWSIYREKAAQCHRLAETAVQPETRKSYETLERQWNAIAEWEDRRIDSAVGLEPSVPGEQVPKEYNPSFRMVDLRHDRACPGHPRLWRASKTWMAGIRRP
ncbi:MAG: hypothetical protein HY543_10005 [Deltaproteobacteria bacterium]|nr:hypothetical protein [Deltaproteobacteria bacterium]